VHIAQTLAPMAALAGYSVTIIDPRRAFATDARFPDVKLIGEWPDETMATMKLDRRTAVVTLTHDPKLDDPALETALKADVFYIGALGSRKTHAARLGRLKAAGFSDAECARIRGPVGLDIGALSPAEIAVSILAQITAVLRGTDAGGRQRRRHVFCRSAGPRRGGSAPRTQREGRQARLPKGSQAVT
jgi:xanthine dehydrogenase accessory factor